MVGHRFMKGIAVGKREQMEKLLEERSRLRTEIAVLKERLEHLETFLAGLEKGIELLGGAAEMQMQDAAGSSLRRRRSSVKNTVLELLSEQTEFGLTAAEVVEVAGARGVDLDRGSVSSLLSKLKGEGILTIEGSKYRIAQPSNPGSASVYRMGGESKIAVG